MALHPAENRGYRELYLTGRHLVERWRRLAEAVARSDAHGALSGAAEAVDEMLAELEPLTAEHDLYGRLAAQGTGARIGSARAAVADRFLERNQGVRLAVCDLEHVMTLLAYLAAVSGGLDHVRLAEFCRSWERRLVAPANAVRRAAVELGGDPDAAVEPLDSSRIGRTAHRAAYAMGTLGEWFDRRTARR